MQVASHFIFLTEKDWPLNEIYPTDKTNSTNTIK